MPAQAVSTTRRSEVQGWFRIEHWTLVTAFFISGIGYSQNRPKDQYPTQYFEGNLGFASSQSNYSFSCHFDGNFNAGIEGKVLMMRVGLGARFSSYSASNRYFVSVPEMIRNPGSLFSPNVPDPDPTKKDSVFVSGVQMQSVNLMFHINFLVKKLFYVGMNGDLIGGSFGSSKTAVYINGSYAEVVTVTPEHYNCFWIGKGDHSGMLLVEFYVSFNVAERIALKLTFQHFDLEYKTDKQVQTFPNPNDRFRLSTAMFGSGIVYSFGKHK